MNSEKKISWLPTKRTCSCPKSALNCLTERQWLRNQVAIWWFPTNELNTKFDTISRTQHPAVFPSALAKRIIRNYTHENETVLDVFSGVGTTLFAAQQLRRNAVGIELNTRFTEFTSRRLGLRNDRDSSTPESAHKKTTSGQYIHQINTDSRKLLDHIPRSSIDLVFSSPPYWDLLKQRQSTRNLRAERHLKKNYSNDPSDLSNDPTLDTFICNIGDIFKKVHSALKPDARCVINTADYRRKGKYIALSNLYVKTLEDLGFELKNIIIWDRRREYDIGIFSYPSNFIVNNGMFEYLLEFEKVKS
jgi:DNA modification methylase